VLPSERADVTVWDVTSRGTVRRSRPLWWLSLCGVLLFYGAENFGVTRATMSTASIGATLYRACLRATRSAVVRNSRFRLPLNGLADELDGLRSFAKKLKPGRDQTGLQTLVRAAWREGAAATDEREIQQRLDDAFRALRALGDLHGDLEEIMERRVANADRRGVSFCIGEVLRHKKFGFRGVIVGWDRRPEVDVSGWDGVVGLPSGADQPFYRIIPDMSDCIENLGGPRDVRAPLPPALSVGARSRPAALARRPPRPASLAALPLARVPAPSLPLPSSPPHRLINLARRRAIPGRCAT
jgi:hypothetical protein